jgi:hypothetical protein
MTRKRQLTSCLQKIKDFKTALAIKTLETYKVCSHFQMDFGSNRLLLLKVTLLEYGELLPTFHEFLEFKFGLKHQTLPKSSGTK